MDDVYMPSRPVNPWGGGCAPTPPPPGPGCKPPPPPPPGCCGPNPPPPGPSQIKPVPLCPPLVEGESYYEAMNTVIERTNACIAQWNMISRNCFEAMNACVEAARSNDVYYDDCEVNYQEGYDENEGCAYAVVEKKAVDRNGHPIRVTLQPAYGNTTNSGVKQSIFDMSFVKSANVIITAVPTQQDNWNGPAMYRGAAIPGNEDKDGYVYGFNRAGQLRYFAGAATETDLCQNGMVDVIGGCIPIISNGAILESAQQLTTKASITAIGFNIGTGSVFFFSCSNYDNPGMTGISVAKLLQGFGCTTAVITSSITEAANVPTTAGMLYMGQMSTVPADGREPENLAYWVISKRSNFKNRFQKEIADLVQTTGQNAWKNYLLGVQIQSFDDRILANAEAIKAETERAMQAEQVLQENIDAEVERATAEENRLDEKIDAETARATAEEQRLDQKIDAETQRATTQEQILHQEIVTETLRATAAENQLNSDLAAEKLRAQTRENEIQAALDKEVRERIAADNDIINAIEQEVLARRAADTALQNTIDAVKNELQIEINNINTELAGITGGTANLPYLKLTGGIMNGPITFASNDTITVGRGPTAPLEVATKKYVDDAIGGGTTPGGDVTKEYVDQQIANVQAQVDGKVAKTGDTMSGTLDMDNNKIQNPVLNAPRAVQVSSGENSPGMITGLGTPVEPSDAVNKQYLDQQLAGVGGDYLELSGGDMIGDIYMTGTSKINFTDQNAQTAMAKPATTRSSTDIDLRPSKAARALGITSELLALARDQGINVLSADVGTVLDAVGTPAGQALMGSVYNDSEDMVVEADHGSVVLKGLDILVQDQAGSDVAVHGVNEIGPVGEASIKFNPLDTEIMGPVKVTNALGEPTSSIEAGSLKMEGIELKPHTMDGQPEHLDINVPTSTGEVYINRSDDTGAAVPGGTGELHLTEIHSPQQLNLRPGSNLNVTKEYNPTSEGYATIAEFKAQGNTNLARLTIGAAFDETGYTDIRLSPMVGGKTNQKLGLGYARLGELAAPTEPDDAVRLRDIPQKNLPLNAVDWKIPLTHIDTQTSIISTVLYEDQYMTLRLTLGSLTGVAIIQGTIYSTEYAIYAILNIVGSFSNQSITAVAKESYYFSNGSYNEKELTASATTKSSNTFVIVPKTTSIVSNNINTALIPLFITK